MKINNKIRILSVKRTIKRLSKIQSEIYPYGYVDPMKYYYLLEYWQEVLTILKNK